MKKIKYGIIGIGGWATEVHIPIINQIDEAEIAALSSRSPDNLEKGYKLITGSPKNFSNYLGLLLEDLDAVIVTTPNHTHAEIVKSALEHDKNVFCEKPLATTVEDCNMLLELARKKGKVLQVGFELRYAPAIVKMKELIAQGEIGKPYLSFCNVSRRMLSRGWRDSPELTGGMFVELGCHYLDLFGFLLSSRAVKVAAFGGKIPEHNLIDHAYVLIDYDNGTKANMRLNMLSPYLKEVIVGVIGDRGKVEADLLNKELTLWQDNFPEYKRSFNFDQGEKEYGFSGTYQQHLDFIHCIRSGSTPKASAEAGCDAVALALAVQEAISRERIVSLEPIQTDCRLKN